MDDIEYQRNCAAMITVLNGNHYRLFGEELYCRSQYDRMTLIQLVTQNNSLVEEIHKHFIWEGKYSLRSQRDFEALVLRTIDHGAKDRRQAVEWLFDGAKDRRQAVEWLFDGANLRRNHINAFRTIYGLTHMLDPYTGEMHNRRARS